MINRVRLVPSKIVNFIIKHKIWGGLIIFAVLIVAFLLRPKPPKPVETVTAKSADLVQTVSITGIVAARNSADLSFPFPGRVVYMPFSEGDNVAKGQIVAALDTRDLEANLRQAEQAFTAAKAASDRLYNAQGYPTTESYDQRAARTAVDATQNQAYDSVVKARKAIADASLVSPIDGVLIHAGAKSVGVNVKITDTWNIVDPSSLEFKMEVDEADIAKVKEGDTVNINLDAYPDDTFKLSISKIDIATHTTSTGGSAYYVTSELPQNSPSTYRIGMNGDADIITANLNNVLQIPISAVQNDDEVLVKTGSKFVVKKVKLGLENDTDVEIVSGLSEGDVVAADPANVPKNLIK